MTLAELIALVHKLSKGSTRNRISTADRYLLTLRSCSGGLCPTDRARYEGPEFDKRLKQATSTLVYRNDLMNALGFSKSIEQSVKEKFTGSVQPIATFDAVYTSVKQDRDSDVLHPEGGEVDPNMPLLWQHDPTQPIGRHLEVIGQDKSKILGRSAIADTPLGRDAAYLAEFGALRISHGFKPKEFAPITEKSGGENIITGFDVTKYEMMEVSLVSVPSNTDAIIEAFSKNKLASPQAKSMAKALDERRRKFFTTGFGVAAMRPKHAAGAKLAPKTGKVKALKPRKDAADFEKALADAASKIVHSGDYGRCFYKAGDSADSYSVWWTAGDADQGQTEDGQPMTSEDDIKSLLGGVAGVSDVQIGDEADPPKDEGWREVYPDVMDWTSSGDGSSGAAQNSEPGTATGDDDAPKGKKPPQAKGKKDAAPVQGSSEAIADAINGQLADYLAQNGVEVPEGYHADVEATFPDSVIVCVAEGDEGEESNETYYRIAYSTDGDGNPTLSGAPQQVELQTVVDDSAAPDASQTPPADGSGGTPPAASDNPPPSGTSAKPNAKGKKKTKWVPVKPSGAKGKLGKKDTNSLKEAVEHVEEARKYDMPNVAKTCLARAVDLMGEVLKSDGTGPDQPADQITDETPGMNPEQRQLWSIIRRMVASKNMDKTSVGELLAELSAKLKAGAVEDLLATLNK